MNHSDRKNWLIGALLCFALALPALFVGEHLHDSITEEVNCDLCLHSIQAGPDHNTLDDLPVFDSIEDTESPVVLPIEQFRLFEYQRGPPVLC